MKIIIYIIFLILFGFCNCWAASYQPVDELANIQRRPIKRSAPAPARSSAPARSTAPRVYVGKDGSLLLFGSVDMGAPLSTVPKWTDVLARNAREPVFQLEKYFNKNTTWKQLKERANGKAPLQQLQIINEFWNKWKYKDDRSNWNVDDYWEIPAQFIKRSGDCEDYSIVKYFTLKELGFDPQKMRIVVLRDRLTGEPHAVLAVYLDNEIYILDNLSPVVLSHTRISHYEPQYSVNEFKRWQHIMPVSK